MKTGLIAFGVLVLGTVAAFAMSNSQDKNNYSWRYKMTVTIETPEGMISGSAVRLMGNDLAGSPLSQNGNPADVKGEAVVVDLGKRGVLFALISHQSDLEFYNAFSVPGGKGGATPEGIKYYASLPVGTKGTLNPKNPPGYPKLVTFTDMNDPKSVTEAQVWTRGDDGYFTLTNDRMEELFGKGVHLKDITLEITDEPVTWGKVDQYLTEGFWVNFHTWFKSMNIIERAKHIDIDLFTFKQGGSK